MEDIVIVNAKRSAIGKFRGTHAQTSAVKLATAVAKETVDNLNVDTVFMGNVLSCGNGQSVARLVNLYLGLPHTNMATTINSVCGSGLQAIILGAQNLQLGKSDVVLAGGVETMSRAATFTINKDDKPLSSLQHDGLYDHFADISMIETANLLAQKYGISGERQDEFAYNSTLKAIKATQNGRFANELVKVNGLSVDETVRMDTSLEKISTVKRLVGDISAANASSLADGAAMVTLMRKSDALAQGLTPLATITAYTASGCEPREMGFAPYHAVTKLLQETQTTIDDYDIIEMTEAFAAQSIAVIDALGINEERLNVNGGAISLGHPLGATGTRLVVTAVHELINAKKDTALITLCIGGGNALALTIKRFKEAE